MDQTIINKIEDKLDKKVDKVVLLDELPVGWKAVTALEILRRSKNRSRL